MFVSTSQQGLNGHKDHVSNEGALSERMRLDHIRKERERQEKERAKMELGIKRRKFDINKEEVRHREIELRRLEIELGRSQHFYSTYEHDAHQKEEKVHQKKNVVHTLGSEIQKLQLQLQQLKNTQTKELVALSHLESELTYMQKEKEKKQEGVDQLDMKKKRGTAEIERLKEESLHLEQEIKHLELKAR